MLAPLPPPVCHTLLLMLRRHEDTVNACFVELHLTNKFLCKFSRHLGERCESSAHVDIFGLPVFGDGNRTVLARWSQT